MRQQVIPYVDNDIRNDWLAAMRSASDGVQTSYAMVIDRAAAARRRGSSFPVISGRASFRCSSPRRWPPRPHRGWTTPRRRWRPRRRRRSPPAGPAGAGRGLG
ncbi:hypothetical protein I548_1605 [Mycobacterium intracellulare]|nr:hypothetical protein I548_1605 [Mycobacterium intracellulare]